MMDSSVVWTAIILGLGFAMTIVVIALAMKRRFYARRQNNMADLDQTFKDAGFFYDKEQNIFCSRMDAWQRDYGYCRLYDEAAAPLSMIFDSEPVHFKYADHNWLIELWKGQYGLTTGCELGVYTTNDQNVNTFTVYECAGDDDLLQMSYSLRNNNGVLFHRSDRHWWLTGFILGEFSEPDELEMDVEITFKDNEMRRSFTNALKDLGYSEQEIKVNNNTAAFIFSEPYSKQPYSRTELLSTVQQKKNRSLCEQYRKIAAGSPDIYKTIRIVQRDAPELYGLIINMGRPAELFRGLDPDRTH